jgi:glycosyltransferase involved in cell wall biosynthesis
LWSVAPMAYAERAGAAGILELNAPLVEEQARYRTLVHTAVARALLAESLRTARVVVAVSDGVAAWARTLLGDDSHVYVVPNGVDPRRFDARFPDPVERELHTERFVIGFVGTLKPWHGLDTLIDAFEHVVDLVPSARLLIVGDGPERRRIETRLVDAGLMDRATLTGAVAHDDVPGFLARLDVAVAPYPPLDDFYFSPLKLTEYMAAGLPVVASAIGQIDALVRHEVTGLLFPPGESDALASALRRLHADAPLRRRLGRAAHDLVARYYTWHHTLERIFELAGVAMPVGGDGLVGAGVHAPFGSLPHAEGRR